MMIRRIYSVVFILIVLAISPQTLAADAPSKLSLPIECTVGKTCWIPNYVDHKPGPGAQDYMCGDATYDAEPGGHHKGTDFAIRDLTVMREGVQVLAVAPGLVVGMRDGMADIRIDQNPDPMAHKYACGNGVRIQHDNGYIGQYCHMRHASVLVGVGDRVKHGQPLGLVGLSGKTVFPHLHFQVSKDDVIVDPFTGSLKTGRCGVGDASLWDVSTLRQLPYQPTAVYNAGFADQKPEALDIQAGAYSSKSVLKTSPALVLWAEFYRVQANDDIMMRITAPNGMPLHEQHIRIEATQAYFYAFSGKRAKTRLWPVGIYRGDIILKRGTKTFEASRQIEIR